MPFGQVIGYTSQIHSAVPSLLSHHPFAALFYDCPQVSRQNLIRAQRTFDQATLISGVVPGCSNPPHSSKEDSGIMPFARDQQQQAKSMEHELIFGLDFVTLS